MERDDLPSEIRSDGFAVKRDRRKADGSDRRRLWPRGTRLIGKETSKKLNIEYRPRNKESLKYESLFVGNSAI